MKIFGFVSSVVAFLATLFFLIADFPDIGQFNGVIYFSLMIILLAMCVTGIITYMPPSLRAGRRIRTLDHE